MAKSSKNNNNKNNTRLIMADAEVNNKKDKSKKQKNKSKNSDGNQLKLTDGEEDTITFSSKQIKTGCCERCQMLHEKTEERCSKNC